MTELTIDGTGAPAHVKRDGEILSEQTLAERVLIEDAVDSQWFIRVEGEALDSESSYYKSEEEFENFSGIVEDLLEGEPDSVESYYGIGVSGNKWVIRIEY